MKKLGDVVQCSPPVREMISFLDASPAFCRVVAEDVLQPGGLVLTCDRPMQLSRDQVVGLRNHLDAWLRTGSLRVDETEEPRHVTNIDLAERTLELVAAAERAVVRLLLAMGEPVPHVGAASYYAVCTAAKLDRVVGMAVERILEARKDGA